MQGFLEEGAHLSIHDPKVSSLQIEKDLLKNKKQSTVTLQVKDLGVLKKIADAIEGSTLMILTEWDEYKKLDWNKVSTLMRKPAWLFDARAMISKLILKNKFKFLEDWRWFYRKIK